MRALGVVVAAEIRMRQQRDLRLDAEQLQAQHGLQRRLGDLLGGRIVSARACRRRTRCRGRSAPRSSPTARCTPGSSGSTLAGYAAAGAGSGRPCRRSSRRLRRAATISAAISVGRERTSDLASAGVTPRRSVELEVQVPVVVEARIVVDVAQLEMHAGADAQAQALDAPLDHRRPADQDRLAPASRRPGAAPRAGSCLPRLRRRRRACRSALARSNTGFISRPVRNTNWFRRLAVGRHVRDRPRRDAGIHRRLRHGRRERRPAGADRTAAESGSPGRTSSCWSP